MLTTPELLLIVIVTTGLLLIVSNRLRADVTAILILLALGFAGLVTPQEAVSGFSRSAVITIIGLFIITEALETSGIVQRIGTALLRLGRGSEVRLILLFMGAGALLSLVMNNIAAGAVLLPAAIQVGRDSNVKLSKLLMPLSFGTLVGGMATYFTTANIIMSGILIDEGYAGLGMGDFVPTGGVIVVLSLLYMALIGRRLLPAREAIGQISSARSLSTSLSETYQLGERLWEARVQPGSRLIGVALRDSRIGEELGITVLAIWRGNQAILTPEPDETIEADDYLLVLGRWERVELLSGWGLHCGRENRAFSGTHNYPVDLTEVIIPPRSTMVGKTLKEVRFRNKYGLTTVALWREGRSYRTDVGIMPLQVGDALLMVGPTARILALAHDRDYIMMQSSHIHQPSSPQKAPWALLILALVLAAALLNLFPLPEVMLAGAMAMVLAGCINMDEAYRAIEWRVIFLIAGMVPVGIALTNTGLGERVGTALVNLVAPYGPLALVVGVFLLTVGVAQVIGGQVTALVTGTIAVTSAAQMGVSPQAMAVTVSIACSAAFLTPIAHPVNVLMMGPGGYRFGDFTRAGIGMTLVTFIGLLIGLVLFWGIR